MTHITTIIEKVSNLWSRAWEYRDKRMDNYFLMDSIIPTIVLIVIYLLVTLVIGPWFMKNRKPYDIKGVIIFYNFFMLVGNGIGVILTWNLGLGRLYAFVWEPVDYSLNPQAVWTAKLIYAFYISKFIDWFDTIFFIMRKKFNHVSGLHVYHHASMPLNTWPLVRFMPGGNVVLGVRLNMLIHTIMYTYYFFSTLGPQWQKYLWWKRYLSILQMVQFVIGLIHVCAAFIYYPDFPHEIGYYTFPQLILILLLFINFYNKRYQNNSVKIRDSKTN